MEGLIQLVSDCLARHGLLAAGNPQPSETAPTLAAAPVLEALPEHNYRDQNHVRTEPRDQISFGKADTAVRETAAL